MDLCNCPKYFYMSQSSVDRHKKGYFFSGEYLGRDYFLSGQWIIDSEYIYPENITICSEIGMMRRFQAPVDRFSRVTCRLCKNIVILSPQIISLLQIIKFSNQPFADVYFYLQEIFPEMITQLI